ncbi:DUF4192 domain-containing protein [Nocardia sp. NPDC006630]|uniref:DUF4192 domain-containing protein n=1 Tax=Nocardia sp. NPDC006630 TaxID=3157181 RepID=UPI0033AA9B7D
MSTGRAKPLVDVAVVTAPPRTLDSMTTPAEPTPPGRTDPEHGDPGFIGPEHADPEYTDSDRIGPEHSHPGHSEPGHGDPEFIDSAGGSEPEPHLRNPGDFIAAVPAMLGFMPARSLVVTVLREAVDEPGTATIDVVARMDLDSPGRAATGQLVERVAGVCVRDTTAAVLALIVDDRATAPVERHRGVRSRRHRDLVCALEHRLDAAAVPLAGAWAVRAIGPELPWWSLLGPARRGRQPDPATSLVTLRHVLAGRPLRGSRAELTDVIEVDAAVRERFRPLLDAAAEAAAHRLAEAVRRDEPESYSRAAVRNVLRWLSAIEAGTLPNARELAEMAVALRDSTVRDILFGLVPGPHARAAETLWLQLTRALPDPDRAEAAMLLGYAAYARGEGPLAGIALEAALNSDPAHRMANLLDIGLQTGMPPQRLRRLADAGREAAADLGVDLRSEHP